MQAADGMTRGKDNDIYNAGVFALIEDYVSKTPKSTRREFMSVDVPMGVICLSN